jgi:hypothetical protein
LPCGLGFFHEVGAKLLVEIGPRVDADTTAPGFLSLPSLAITRLFLLLSEEKEMRNTYSKRDKVILSRPKTEKQAVAFGALFSLQCVRFITRGSLFIGDTWV